MNDYLDWLILIILITFTSLVDKKVQSAALRKWSGLVFVVTGPVLLFSATPWIRDLPLEILPVFFFFTGISLLIRRNQFHRTKPSHPLLLAPTLNLAPNFPDDPIMQHLLQLLHEDVGLPKHQTITLNTSINHDLDGNRSEAKQLMTALKQDFGMSLGDFKIYRYFKRRGLDTYLRYRERGSAGKLPLTIGMLYQAIKAKRWDTQTLENPSAQNTQPQ